jgi:hypothetical protein
MNHNIPTAVLRLEVFKLLLQGVAFGHVKYTELQALVLQPLTAGVPAHSSPYFHTSAQSLIAQKTAYESARTCYENLFLFCHNPSVDGAKLPFFRPFTANYKHIQV